MKLAASRIAIPMLLALASAGPAAAAFTVNGSLEGDYGAVRATQTTQTNFGDNNVGAVDNANGSELDLAYAAIQGDKLYVFLAGNLESNFNKLDIFIDAIDGGQQKLRGDNPNVDFNGLNRMGDDGSNNGLRFDVGFLADYYIGMGGGGGPYQLFVNYAELKVGGVGNFLGQTGAGGSGTLTGGTNPQGIKVAIDNGNVAGVTGGCAAAGGAGVTRGIELMIPLGAIGGASAVKICAFVNGGGHDFVSNQVLGPLASGTCNLGEPRAVDFGSLAGNQFFSVSSSSTVPVGTPLVLALTSLVLLGGAIAVLRRRAPVA
jgi:hypothetical protein